MQKNETSKKRIPVLLYHRVDHEADKTWRPFCVSPQNFAEQMAWLASHHYRTIDLHTLLDYFEHGEPAPDNALVITFDDGYLCNYSRAFPLMAKYGFTGTIFLAGNLLRNEGPPAAESRQSFMSWEEAREMQTHGWSLQSHGLDHVKMTGLRPEQLRHEIFDSRNLISDKLGRRVDFFCYPFAEFNQEVMDCVRESGYRGACGGPPFYDNGPVSPLAIGRTEILWRDSFKQFCFKMRHGLGYYYFMLRQLGKAKRLLVRTPQPQMRKRADERALVA